MYREDDEVKAEWHLKRSNLRENLKELTSQRMAENLDERKNLLKSPFLEETVAKINNFSTTLINTEILFFTAANWVFLKLFTALGQISTKMIHFSFHKKSSFFLNFH